jgi:hypothetical protein
MTLFVEGEERTGNGNGKSKIRGFSAALRMTKCGGERRRTGNSKDNCKGKDNGAG